MRSPPPPTGAARSSSTSGTSTRYIKRARLEHADPETLEYVPQWYGDRMLAHAAARGARISLAGADEAGPARRPRPRRSSARIASRI